MTQNLKKKIWQYTQKWLSYLFIFAKIFKSFIICGDTINTTSFNDNNYTNDLILIFGWEQHNVILHYSLLTAYWVTMATLSIQQKVAKSTQKWQMVVFVFLTKWTCKIVKCKKQMWKQEYTNLEERF